MFMPLCLAPSFTGGFMFSRRRHDDVVIPAKAGIHSFIFSLARPCNSLAGFLWAGVQTLGIQMFSPQFYWGFYF